MKTLTYLYINFVLGFLLTMSNLAFAYNDCLEAFIKIEAPLDSQVIISSVDTTAGNLCTSFSNGACVAWDPDPTLSQNNPFTLWAQLDDTSYIAQGTINIMVNGTSGVIGYEFEAEASGLCSASVTGTSMNKPYLMKTTRSGEGIGDSPIGLLYNIFKE